MVNDTRIDRWIHPSKNEKSNSSFDEMSSKLWINTLRDQKQLANVFENFSARPRTSKSGPELRFINPAIYAESIDGEGEEEIKVCIRVQHRNDDNIPESHSVPIIEASCGDGVNSSNRFADLPVYRLSDGKDVDPVNNLEAYRCSSSTSITESSLDPFTTHSKAVRIERRCKMYDTQNVGLFCARRTDQPEVQRYTVNGHRVVKLSTVSLSSSASEHERREGTKLTRRLAYEEWMRKKQLDAQRKKQEEERSVSQKHVEEERLAREREEKERRDRENFLRWTERKRKEEEIRKAILEKELELQERLKLLEEKTAMAKTLHLRQWARKKEDEQKEQQRKQRVRQKKIDVEREKRLQESANAYEKWREKSKNRPKPATQGLLPHQKAKPSYVNPLPWKSIIDDNPDDAQQDEPQNGQSRIMR